MRSVKYKTLRIQNFLSIGNDVVTIEFQKGLNLITGNNIDNPERKNAVGKSALICGFYFALFGDTIRKIKKEFIVNNVTKGKGCVELEFDVETDQDTKSYKIVRQVKPSKVELYCNGEDITGNSIGKNKEFISELIGSNPTLCRSCDILSLSDNVPFMAKKLEEKRVFINDIFSLEVFGKMSKELKELVKTNKQDMSISVAKLDEINNSLVTLEKQEEASRKQEEEREKVLKERKSKLEEQIKITEDEIGSIKLCNLTDIQTQKEKFEEALGKVDIKLSGLQSEITSKETTNKIKSQELKKAFSVGGASCDKCLQEIPHSHIEHLEKVKEDLNIQTLSIYDEIVELNTKKTEFQKKKNLINQKLLHFQEEINNNRITQQKIESLQRSLKQYKESLTNLDEDSKQAAPLFKQSIDETLGRKSKENDKFTLLKQTSDDLDICKFILGEEGVKSFVVKKLLGMLNSSIQQYINDLGMTTRCKFDEYFDEQMTNDKGKEISYWNLSGAERKTVDIACAWAFKDIRMKISGVSSNVEWVDELYDSSVDEIGLDKLIEITQRRIEKNQFSIYAISHRKETLKHITGEVINLEKDGGITRRIL